jgi:hypothetical protein
MTDLQNVILEAVEYLKTVAHKYVASKVVP